MLPHWWSSTKRFSHVWLQTTCESRNILKSFYTLATYVWWQFLRICKSIFGVFFLGGVGERAYIQQNITLWKHFSKWWKFAMEIFCYWRSSLLSRGHLMSSLLHTIILCTFLSKYISTIFLKPFYTHSIESSKV